MKANAKVNASEFLRALEERQTLRWALSVVPAKGAAVPGKAILNVMRPQLEPIYEHLWREASSREMLEILQRTRVPWLEHAMRVCMDWAIEKRKPSNAIMVFFDTRRGNLFEDDLLEIRRLKGIDEFESQIILMLAAYHESTFRPSGTGMVAYHAQHAEASLGADDFWLHEEESRKRLRERLQAEVPMPAESSWFDLISCAG